VRAVPGKGIRAELLSHHVNPDGMVSGNNGSYHVASFMVACDGIIYDYPLDLLAICAYLGDTGKQRRIVDRVRAMRANVIERFAY